MICNNFIGNKFINNDVFVLLILLLNIISELIAYVIIDIDDNILILPFKILNINLSL